MLDTIEALREELGLQGGLLDKEMLLHKAALEKLISASSPNMKFLTSPTSFSTSYPSISTTPSKRLVQFNTAISLQSPKFSDTDFLSSTAPVPISSSSSLPLSKSIISEENKVEYSENQQMNMDTDTIRNNDDNNKNNNNNNVNENVKFVFPTSRSPKLIVNTTWKDEKGGERTGGGIELGRVSVSPPIQNLTQDPSINENKISVLSEEIRSLNR